MARDRQRSKARQRARATGDQSTPRKRRRESRSREIGLDDPSVDDAGLTDDVPTPDPLKNAMPDVDIARAAETGADVPGPNESVDLTDDEAFELELGEDFDRAEDQVEVPRDLVRGGRSGAGGRGDLPTDEEEHDHEFKDRGRVITFIRACIDELRRVQWPDRKHVFSATAVVLGFVLIAGGWLGLMDAIWQPLINAIL